MELSEFKFIPITTPNPNFIGVLSFVIDGRLRVHDIKVYQYADFKFVYPYTKHNVKKDFHFYPISVEANTELADQMRRFMLTVDVGNI